MNRCVMNVVSCERGLFGVVCYEQTCFEKEPRDATLRSPCHRNTLTDGQVCAAEAQAIFASSYTKTKPRRPCVSDLVRTVHVLMRSRLNFRTITPLATAMGLEIIQRKADRTTSKVKALLFLLLPSFAENKFPNVIGSFIQVEDYFIVVDKPCTIAASVMETVAQL